jgi:hypothetical protein
VALRRPARGTGRHRVPDPPAPAVRCGQGSHRGRCRDLGRGGRHGSGGYRLVQAQLRRPSRTGAVGIAAAVDALARTVLAAAYLAPAVVILAVVVPVVPDLVPAVLVLAVADLVLALASAVALAFTVTVAFTLALALPFRVPVVPVILATAVVIPVVPAAVVATAIIVAADISLTATVVPDAIVFAAVVFAAAGRLVLTVGARPASHLVMSLPRRTTGARRARAGRAGRWAWRCCRGAGRRT